MIEQNGPRAHAELILCLDWSRRKSLQGIEFGRELGDARKICVFQARRRFLFSVVILEHLRFLDHLASL